MWATEKKCGQLIEASWVQNFCSFLKCHNKCWKSLIVWHPKEFKEILNKIKNLKSHIQNLVGAMDSLSLEKSNKLELEL